MPNINIFNFENPSFNLKNLFSRKRRFEKSNVRILFIDDEVEDFPVIQNLKDAGWSVEGVKDVQNVEDDIVKCSQIIFVDYRGVGQTLSEREQGIGLIKLLKETYGNSKRVGLYSGHNRFSLGHNIDVADFRLPKNTDTSQFIATIQREIKKLK